MRQLSTQSEAASPHFGIPVWRDDNQSALYFAVEGRVLFDRVSDIDSNYQFWGGLRYLFGR